MNKHANGQPAPVMGAEVLPYLARIYAQLYLTPGAESAEAYKKVVLYGEAAPACDLSHFTGDGRDSCVIEQTPVGDVRVVTLHQRRDFETFLQIMAFRCTEKQIPATQGASILDGVINWTRIRAHKDAFLRSGAAEDAWPEEFQRFTADKNNFKDALIVLSAGPYSAIGAEAAGMTEEDWLAASHEIRRAHECTHLICRRRFPELIDPVWDEITADAVGLYAAFGRYDTALAALFLGAGPEGYTGGRLENYVPAETEGRQEVLDRTAKKVYAVIHSLADRIEGFGSIEPYDLAIRLEEAISCWKEL